MLDKLIDNGEEDLQIETLGACLVLCAEASLNNLNAT